MIKLTFCLRRKEGLSYEEFHDYWLNKHGPLVRKQMEALKIRKYVQVHQLNEPEFNAGIGRSRNAPAPFDGIAELWYDSLEAMERSSATPEARTLYADGALFIGKIKTYVVDEKVIIE